MIKYIKELFRLEHWTVFFKKSHLFEKMFLRWWLFACVQIVFVFMLQSHFDVFGMIYQDDITFISFFIMAIFAIMSLVLGAAIYSGRITIFLVSSGWFIADTMMYLGLIGTVIGFIILFRNLPIAENLIGDVLNTTALIIFMLPKLGIALFTTASGLICSLLLKFQLMNVELEIQKIENQ